MAKPTSDRLYWERVCNRDLGINDLDIVYSKVESLSPQWMLFAELLHLQQFGPVKNLEENESHDPDYCLKKVLEYWLKRDHKYKQYGVPCWRLVCVAVEELGDSALAEEIAREYPLPAGVTSSKVEKRDFLLLNKLYELKIEFADFLQKTIQYFNSKSNFPEIIDFLIKHIISSLGPHSSNPTLVEAVTDEFQSITSIEKLFSLLQHKYLSWFQFDSILKRLIDKFFSKNNILRRSWREYEIKLNSCFSEQNLGKFNFKIFEGIQFGEFNRPPAAAVKVTAKIGREDYSLYDLFMSCKLNLMARATLNAPGFYIYFSFVFNGSYLEYWIPDFVHSLIFPLTSDQRLSLREIDITELSTDVDIVKLWFQELEKRLKRCDELLKNALDGAQYFIDQMTLNDLATSKEFDPIMSEFKTKLQSSSLQELKENYNIFIEILEKLNRNDIISKLKVDWSALPKKGKKSWLTAAKEVDMSSKSFTDFERDERDQPMKRRPTSGKYVIGKQLEVSIGKQMVLGSQKLQESTSTHIVHVVPSTVHDVLLISHDELLTNGFNENIQLKNEPETTRQFEISFTKMKDIILHETIPCNLFLIAFFGLPSSKKSILVDNFLKEAAYTIPNGLDPLSVIEHNEKGLSVYNTTLLQHNSDKYLWFTLARELKESHPCSSAILSMSFLYNYRLNIVFNGDVNHVFQDKILDAHFNAVCKSVKQRDLIQCSYELQRILSSRMVDVNIIDDGTNAGATKFLSCIFNHLSCNLGFVCLSLNDLLGLNRPSNPSHKSADIAAINTRVLHFIHDALRMHSSAAPFIFIIICSERDTESNRKTAKDILLNEITSINRKSGPQAAILVLDPYSLNDMKELRNVLNDGINEQCISRKDIKLSWLFLLSALHSSLEDIVISYEKLKEIAEKLGIKGTEVKEFLEMFSKFMSILYFSSFKPLQNFIILRPVEFINTLSLLFKIPGGKTNFNGLHTNENINKIIPNKEQADIITDVLCSFGLAMKMKSEKVAQSIFVPLANNGHILEKSTTINTSLFIVYESRLNLSDYQCFFASQFLAHSQGPGIKKSSLQVGLEHRNIFKVFLQTIQLQDYTFSFIFHDEYIEVACTLKSNIEFNVFQYIFNCCSEALSKINSVIKDFTYKLALKCLTPPSIQTDDLIDSAKKVFEFFPQSESSWCHECKSSLSPQRKYWKELIEKKKHKEERREPVNEEKLLKWAQKIGPHIKSERKLFSFAQRLSVTIDVNYLSFLHKECPPWQQVLMIFSILDKRNEATREKIEAGVAYLRLSRDILD